MPKLVLLRHGQSVWNLENRFTGWTDVEMTPEGIDEAHRAGCLLRESGLSFDYGYTSVLKRSIFTMWIVLEEINQAWIPTENDWRLNERHYGALQGLNKTETAALMGSEQVMAWRRSFLARPPALEFNDPRHPRFDRRYRNLPPEMLPQAESLQDTLSRVMDFWQKKAAPRLLDGQTLLIAAHGNSLRALVMYLNQIPENDVPELNIPTGKPLVYDLDEALHVEGWKYL